MRVQVLSRHRLERLLLEGPSRHQLRWTGTTLLEQDPSGTHARPLPLHFPRGRWTLQLPGGLTRHYVGTLELHAIAQQLQLVLTTPLEPYVASVVQAESDPQTPAAALEALAVVVRSFAIAHARRHPQAELCDLAHCQVYLGRRSGPEAQRAQRATLKTRGQRLVLADQRPALPLFHAACGGHTLDPQTLYEGEDLSGAAAVPDVGCPPQHWQLRLSREALQASIDQLFWPGGEGGMPRLEQLRLIQGPGAVLRWVQDVRSGEQKRGERLFRLLGEAQGWDRLRSPRFTWERWGEGYRISGTGLGHGVGLCQLGARRRALAGASAETILQHYFPHARPLKE